MKIGEDVDDYDWEVIETPQQSIKNDSGIFLILIIKALIFNLPFDFSAESIEFQRTLIAYELKNKTLYN